MLGRKVARGFIWVGLSNGLGQVIKLISKIVLARLLLPEDFGLVAIGLFIIGGFSLLYGFGISTSLIRKKEDIPEAADAAFILSLVIGVILFISAYVSAGPLAGFFHKSEITGIVRILSITFIISSFELVPSALLTKEIEFRKRFIPEVASTLVYAIVSILLALLGAGYWSLVYGYLSSTIVSVCLMWHMCNFRPSFSFNRKVARDLLGYGKFVVATTIVAFLITQCDNAFVGKLLGISALGFYSMAYSIANLPSTGMSLIVAGAMYPVFSKLQDDPPALKNVFVKSLKIILIVVLPVSMGMILLSNEFVRLLLGEKWLPISGALRVLSVFVIFRSIQNLIGPLLQAVGEAKTELINAIFEACLMFTAILPLTLRFNIIGTSVAMTLMISFGCIRLLYIVKKIIALNRLELINMFMFSLVSSIIMSFFIIIIKPFLLRGPQLLGLVTLVFSSALIYFSALVFLDRKIISEGKALIKLAFRKI